MAIRKHGFAFKLKSRGIHIQSRRRARVWLKQCEDIVYKQMIMDIVGDREISKGQVRN